MRTRVLALLMAGAVAGGFVGIAEAARPEDAGPGPNGNNNHGLCTAFFNGQKNGHDKNGNPGPFAALIEEADDGDDETSPIQDVYNYCQQFGIGGNPDENGRYTDCFDDSDGDPETDSCSDGQSA